MNKCLLSRPGLIAGPLHSTPLQINSQSIPRLDPIDSKSSSLVKFFSAFGYDEYDAQVFEMPKNKGRTLTLARKSVTGSSTDITSPKKEQTSHHKMASRDDCAIGEFQSRSVSPRKV